MKKILIALFILPVVGFILFFNSCSDFDLTGASSTTPASTKTASNNDDDNDDYEDEDDDPEDCEESEGDPCDDSDYCKDTCRLIYSSIIAVNSCKSRGEDTVGVLTEIHDRLMGEKADTSSFENRTADQVKKALKKITDDSDDIGPEDLKCYLQIGSKKYIEFLKDGLGDDSTAVLHKDRLLETLKWIVENKDITEVLEDLNSGDDILKSILETLSSYYTLDKDTTESNSFLAGARCIKSDTNNWYAYRPNNTQDYPVGTLKDNQQLDQWLWWIEDSSDDELNFWYLRGTTGAEKTVGDVDTDLYKALSCFHYIDEDSDNIFTYSAKEDNDWVFKTAFNMLENSCDDVQSEQKPACLRALMCWSSWQKVCYENRTNPGEYIYKCHKNGNNFVFDTTPSATTVQVYLKHSTGTNRDLYTSKLWNEVRKYSDQLEKNNGTDYFDCTTKAFADFR